MTLTSLFAISCDLNDTLLEEQNGFRDKRSCEEHISCLDSIININLHENKSIFCAFIDIAKAFDLVERELLGYKLLK